MARLRSNIVPVGCKVAVDIPQVGTLLFTPQQKSEHIDGQMAQIDSTKVLNPESSMMPGIEIARQGQPEVIEINIISP